jgi:hypothetical protein
MRPQRLSRKIVLSEKQARLRINLETIDPELFGFLFTTLIVVNA